jgi:hypothetical protein
MLSPHTAAVMTEDGTVLLNERTGHYWQLNRTGAYALEQLSAGQPLDRVATDIAARYGIDPIHVRTDITAMTDRLTEAGLWETGCR